MVPLALRRLVKTLLCFLLVGGWSVCTPALQPASSPQRYARQAWSTENGLPQNSVHAMLQTTDGYLWFATEGGLARFNGYAFRIFDRDSEPRLAGNDIRCLLESRSHALWIGTSSGLTRLQDGISRTYTSADGLPSDDIRSLLQGNDGTLWVLTSSGLASLAATSLTTEKMRFHNYARSDGPLGSEVNAIVEAAEGGVWAADSRGLFLVNNGSAKRILQASPATVSALTTGTGGSL